MASLVKATFGRGTGKVVRKSHVLIVDDEEPVRRFVERVLQRVGHTTTCAVDGAEAIEVASTLESIDLVVTISSCRE